jgi:two-component system, cell cycle response regulator DivK
MAKILYVEDNPQNMRLVKKMLKTGGYDMIEAMDGNSGIQIACDEMPDLILMDINLPDIDGLEATAKIKGEAMTTHIPIIALTANAMIGDKERFIGGGCDGYLAKPISRKELLETIKIFLPE